MRVDLKEVKYCRNGAAGNFLLRGPDYALITVSMKYNQLLVEYCVTVLHELLHLWVTIMRMKGFKTTDTKEHEFIYAVDRVVTRLAKKHLKSGRRK